MQTMMREFFSFGRELLKVVVVSLLIILPIRHFVVQPFFVRGESMEPSFYNGDYLIVDELSYHMRQAQRGEVVVFRFPDNDSQYYIKRVIGLPNEKVEIQNGEVWVQGPTDVAPHKLGESYLNYGMMTSGAIRITLSANEVFVMGDNRVASYDSRQWGTLPTHYIVGRAWIRMWPLKDFEVISLE